MNKGQMAMYSTSNSAYGAGQELVTSNKFDADGDGDVDAQDILLLRAATSADQDGDGTLTQAEIKAHVQAVDKDGDGVLTREEAEKALANSGNAYLNTNASCPPLDNLDRFYDKRVAKLIQ